METKLFNISGLIPLSAYSIFIGIIEVRTNIKRDIERISGLIPWQTHIFPDGSLNKVYDDQSALQSSECIEKLKEYYYPGFVNALFPTLNSYPGSEEVNSYTIPLNEKVSFDGAHVMVSYLDLFFLPGEHLIYCFKCDFNGLSIEEISRLNDLIRNKKPNDLDFIYSRLRSFMKDETGVIGGKHKIFSCISHDTEFSDHYSVNHLLYDLGTCSPVGTSVGMGNKPFLKPSSGYFNSMMDEHLISVFDNWTALALFDTFIIVHRGEVYNYNWEFRYFRFLYIHSLFIKTALVSINTEFYAGKMQKNLVSKFHIFDKNFNFKQISFNFLPQFIYEKIRKGVNLEQEMSDIRFAIENDHHKKQEQRNADESKNEKRLNSVLFIIALLAVIETVWHLSEWIWVFHEGERNNIFEIGSFAFLLLLYFLIYYLLKHRKQRYL